jgi:hypothetical protein
MEPRDLLANVYRPVLERAGLPLSPSMPLLLLSEWLSEPSLPRRSCLECLLGGVRVLVGPPVFKTGVSSDPAQAGSIPVRLR